MTAKAIGNRIKAKGLQQLKYYCQMCAKQCRDANGFKCHCLSESHLRQMAIAAADPSKVIDAFSEQFEKDFIALVSRRFGERRVHANLVYNELIQHKEHTHMNATIWATLTDFVKYLGRTGKCVVDESEKGWFLRYKSTDPRIVKVRQAAARRMKAALADEEITARRIAEQVSMARAAARERGDDGAPEVSELHRVVGDAVTITFNSGGGGSADGAAGGGAPRRAASRVAASVFGAGGANAFTVAAGGAAAPVPSALGRKRKAPSEMERMMEQEIAKRRATESSSGVPIAVAAAAGGSASRASRWGEAPAPGAAADAADAASAKKQQQKKEKKKKEKKKKKKKKKEHGAGADAPADDAPPWLLPNIMVRVVNKTLGKGAFYKHKGRVVSVNDGYCATVAMVSGGATGKSVRIDQDELETVVPSSEAGAGPHLLTVVGGPHRGQSAALLSCNRKRYRATVRLAESGAELVLDYEDVCLSAP